MRGIFILTGLFASILNCAIAAPASLPRMTELNVWGGPFDDTTIIKYADRSEGVVCYVYTPRSIGTSLVYGPGGQQTHFAGDIGSISCVKVDLPLIAPSASKGK